VAGFGEWAGDRVGQHLAAYNYDQNNVLPYRLDLSQDSTLSRLAYSTINPFTFAAEFGALPVKAAIGLSALRSAWYASRTLGLTSSLSDPFDPNRRRWAYRASTVRGPVGKFIEGVDKFIRGEGYVYRTDLTRASSYKAILADAFPKFFRVSESQIGSGKDAVKKTVLNLRPSFMHRGTAPPRGIDELTGSWLRRRVYSGAAEEAFVNAEKFGIAGAANRLGVMERFFLNTSSVMDVVRDTDPDLYKMLKASGGKDELAARTLKNLDSARRTGLLRKRYDIAKDRLKDLRNLQRTKHVSMFRALGQSITGTIKGIWSPNPDRYSEIVRLGKWVTGEAEARPILMHLGRAGRRNTLAQVDAIGAAMRSMVAERMTKNPASYLVSGGAKVVEGERLAAYGRLAVPSAADEVFGTIGSMRKAQQAGATALDSTALQQGITNAVASNQRRMAWLRRGKQLAGVGLITAVGASLAKHAVRTAIEVPARLAATTRALTRPEFGGGEVISNAAVATERQRAIQAIQNAHLNARYLMGNEASLYH